MSENVAADQLRLIKGVYSEFIERIEHLEEEKRGLGDDLKSTGYDVKTVRSIVKLRRLESHARQEAEALLETYKAALGLD